MGLLCVDCARRRSIGGADSRAESGLSQRDRHLDQHDPGTTTEWTRLEQSRLFVLQGRTTRFGRRLPTACDRAAADERGEQWRRLR